MAAQKYAVTGDKYIAIDKKIADIKRQLRQEGGSPIDPDYLNWALQRLGEGMRFDFRQKVVNPNIVIVPDLAAVELTALAKHELWLTYLDAGYKGWDYYRDVDGNPIAGRGQMFEAFVWKPEIGSDVIISSEQARAYLRDRGYTGHVGAFTQWCRQSPDLMGYHTSIPEDGACWRHANGRLCVPFSSFIADTRSLAQLWIGDGWRDYWSFVGFRAIA